MILNIENGWDIEELTTDGNNKIRTPDNSKCNDTSTYNGKCYRSEDLNYMLFASVLSDINIESIYTDFRAMNLGEHALFAYIKFIKYPQDGLISFNKIGVYYNTKLQLPLLKAGITNTISMLGIKEVNCCSNSKKYNRDLNAKFRHVCSAVNDFKTITQE